MRGEGSTIVEPRGFRLTLAILPPRGLRGQLKVLTPYLGDPPSQRSKRAVESMDSIPWQDRSKRAVESIDSIPWQNPPRGLRGQLKVLNPYLAKPSVTI